MKQGFIDAVESKDLYSIRSYITSEIIEDPTFSGKGVEECITYLEEKGVNIYEPFAPTPCETPIPSDMNEWDNGLFYDKVEDLLHNFAFEERIEDIIKIGRHVYARKAAPIGNAGFEDAPKGRRSEKKTKGLTIAAVAAIAAAAVLVIILLLTK